MLGFESGSLCGSQSRPEGYHNLTPYLVVKGVAQPIDILRRSLSRSGRPDRRLGSASRRGPIGTLLGRIGEPTRKIGLNPSDLRRI